MAAPVETPPAESRPDAADCPRCGSAVSPSQEYCLECGAALPASPGPSPRRARAWAWSALVTAVVAVLAAGVVVAARMAQDGDERSALVATTAQPAVPETTTPEPAETTGEATTPPAATTEAETEPPPPPQGAEQLIRWPRGTRGWTVVLASIPIDRGRTAATRRAKDAAEAGLSQVGVLESSQYSSLHPGYFVVFSGVYDSQRQAEQAVALAGRAGFDAYPREIVP